MSGKLRLEEEAKKKKRRTAKELDLIPDKMKGKNRRKDKTGVGGGGCWQLSRRKQKKTERFQTIQQTKNEE